MIGDINNLILYSQILNNEITIFTFSFDKPTGTIGGYNLYISYDNITFMPTKFRIDYKHYDEEDVITDFTYEAGGKVYFEYATTSNITDGRILYFKLQAISESNELSNFSSIIQTYTAPTRPTNLLVVYDGYQNELTWDPLSTSTGKNTAFTNFNIYRKEIIELSDFQIVEDTISHPDFEPGIGVWIIDRTLRSMWFGLVTTEGEFVFDDTNKIILASDNSEDAVPSVNNLRCLIEDPTTSILVGQPTTNTYIDNTFYLNKHYIYTVTAESTTNKESEESKFPMYTIDVEEAYPYLRPPGNSDNTILQQSHWRAIKNVLIDANYWDKTKFAIPYFKNEVYNLKGYLGVSNCKLDVYINNIYTYTTTTGNYGEFDLDYPFKKEIETLVTFQARDKFNIKFSRRSAPNSIRVINFYTWFAALGEEYDETLEEIEYLKTDVNINLARYSSFVDRFAPLIEFYKIGDENETIFRTLASQIFQAFEYASYDESLNMLLDVFRDNLDNFDHYEIYYNENLYGTQRTAYTFTATSTGLARDDYYYGVSACRNDGAETDITPIRVDRRWWPASYYNENVLMWDNVADADFYKVYRGETSTGLQLLTSTEFNFFIDINGYIPNPSIVPRLYNYTSLLRPKNLFLYDRYGVNNLFLRLKKPSSLVIILYGRGNEELEDYNIQRLLILFEKFIPPEILYRIIFANNDKVILYPEGKEIDITEPEPIYARYDISNYDGDEVYA